jgi:transposase
VALRLLVDRRDELSRRRVQALNRLHRLLAELIPGGAKKDLSALQAKALLARDSHLMDLNGVGPAGAARILVDVGDVARFAYLNRFAAWTGTAPLDASSGADPSPALPRRQPPDEPRAAHRRDRPAAR